MLVGGKVGGELLWRDTRECCLTGAVLVLWQEGLVMEWTSLAGLGAVGGGAGLGETGGGIFFPSPDGSRKTGHKQDARLIINPVRFD